MIYSTIFYLLFAWLIYEKVIKLYYRYWFYKKQGIPTMSFPLPVFGNLLGMKKALDNMNPYSKTILEEYWHNHFGETLPPIFADMRIADGSIVFCDPNYVKEIYTTKTKYMDKHPKFYRIAYEQFKDSTFLQKSSELWVQKRKHLSAAFYKDKIKHMLKSAIVVTNQKVQEWRLLVEDKGDQTIILNKQAQEMIDDVIQVCVFGQSVLKKQIGYIEKGKTLDFTIGKFLRLLTQKIFNRYGGPVRQLCDFFDYLPITWGEYEGFKNARNFRKFVKMLIDERRVEMADPNYTQSEDFLTIMLQDPFFDSDEMIIDECNSFMIAANITTSMTLTNALYYLTKHKDILGNVREIIKKEILNGQDAKTLDDSKWGELLTYEGLQDCNYLQYCILETLRIDPPARVTSPHCFTEKIDILGIEIFPDTQWHVNIQYLHHNPKEWIDPETFIPERFDPSSRYYLTPAGEKRHPMSFGPFLGGRRICLGKTFAESILKCILPVILTQVDFDFADDSLRDRKPINTFLLQEPEYLVKIKKLREQ
eukprot:403350965